MSDICSILDASSIRMSGMSLPMFNLHLLHRPPYPAGADPFRIQREVSAFAAGWGCDSGEVRVSAAVAKINAIASSG